MDDKKVFWREDFTDGEAQGGIFVIAVELRKFIDLVEKNENGNGGEVVGLKFSENNLELIVKRNPDENDS